MPKLISSRDEPNDLNRELALKDAASIRRIGENRRREIRRRFSPIDLTDTRVLPGERQDNTPSLRKDAKFRNRLELSDHTYRTDIGKVGGLPVVVNLDGSVNVKGTLSLLTLYRHHLAAKTHIPKDLKDVE